MPKLELTNMAHQLPRTRDWQRSFAPPTMWNMSFWFLPGWHQTLCKWQQQEVCARLAYSTQHTACENKYQYLKVGGIDTRRRWIPIAIEGGIDTSGLNQETFDPGRHFENSGMTVGEEPFGAGGRAKERDRGNEGAGWRRRRETWQKDTASPRGARGLWGRETGARPLWDPPRNYERERWS